MVTLLKVVPSCFGLWIYFLFSFQLLYVPQLFNLPVVIWTQKINSMLICQNWLCFLLKYPAICFNLDAVSAVTGFVFIQKLYCPFSVLNLLKIYSLPVKFLSGALPTFGGWGEGFGWLCYCTLDTELFSVVSGKFLQHQQHWEVHYGHSYSCPIANNLSSRRSWGAEFHRNTLKMNSSTLSLSMEWHSRRILFCCF